LLEQAVYRGCHPQRSLHLGLLRITRRYRFKKRYPKPTILEPLGTNRNQVCPAPEGKAGRY
jgi:hypothetical protein